MRVEQIVGSRMRDRREELGLTQEHIGAQLEPLLGRPWSRQAVSAAEKGDRSFAAAELVALAAVLHVTVADLLRPPVQEPHVYLGGPYPVPRDVLLALVTARVRDDLNLGAIQDTLTLLADTAGRSQEDVAQTLKLARDLDKLITQRVAGGGVVSLPLAPGMEAGTEQRQPIVAAVVTSRLGVLVGKRNDGKPPWTFIAGEVEPGEQAADAAVREVKEETGLEIEAGEIIGERVHPATGRSMVYMAGRPVRGTEVFVGDRAELAEVRWVSLDEAGVLLPGMYEPVREYLAATIGGGER